jgi:predicted secreted protein
MSRIGLVGPSYALANISADDQATINWFVSQDESGAGNAPLILDPCPGTKTFVDLGRTITPEVDGLGVFDQAGGATGSGTAVATGSLTPSSTPEFALFGEAKDDSSGFTFTPDAGWITFASQTYQQIVNAAINGTGTITGGSANWAAALVLFKQIGASAPAIVQSKTIVSGAWTTGTHSASFTNPVQAGNTILVILEGNQTSGTGANMSVTDGIVYPKLIDEFLNAGNKPQYTMFARQNIAAGTPLVAATTAGTISGQITMYEVQGGTEAVTNSGPVRGLLTVTGRTFAVCGQDFDEILGNGTFINRGTVSNDSLTVTMAATPQQLLLASAGTAYVFDLMANTLTAIPGATFAGPVSQAATCDGFFILTIQNSKEFYVSAPLDATDWVTNGAAIVSVFADNIVSMLVHDREIWFWSDRDRTVYYDSGNIFPFDVISGTTIQAGSAAKSSPVRIDDHVLWLNADDNGTATVKMGSGYTPQRISNHAIEFAMQGYARVDDAVGTTYQLQGHNFYALYFPTPSANWVFDTLTGMWHEELFWIGDSGRYQAAHRWNHTYNFGMHLVGDWQSGKVYQMQIPTQAGSAWTFADDDGATIRRARRAPHISREQKWVFYHYLNLFVETGLGPIPPLPGPVQGPPVLTLADDANELWDVTIADDGTVTINSSVFSEATTIVLNDAVQTLVSWQLAIDESANLFALAVPYSATNGNSFPMATTPSGLQSALTLS